MLNCHWQKKYQADLEREERLAKTFKPMFGPNGPEPNWHDEAAQRARQNLHTLTIDHRLGGCSCQASRPFKELKK